MARRLAVLSVPSSSSPGKEYQVWVGVDGPVFCDCPAHKFHRGKPAGERPDCKHMRALRNEGTALATARLVAASVGPVKTFTPPPTSRGIRFIEVQEEDDDGVRVTVANLSRINNLEV